MDKVSWQCFSNSIPFAGERHFTEFYWCPDPRKVGENNEFSGNSSVGECPKFLHPPENGCPENYIPMEDSKCIRVSSFPETFEKAELKCESEGGFLFQYTNNEITVNYDTLKESLCLKIFLSLGKFGKVFSIFDKQNFKICKY